MRSVSDEVSEPVYIDMFAERAELRETLSTLRSQLSTQTGTGRTELEKKIAKIEKDIRDLTKKLPSNMR
ncbi:hypothetical protein ACC721_05735 [Rhizobium ruizarguesonis]